MSINTSPLWKAAQAWVGPHTKPLGPTERGWGGTGRGIEALSNGDKKEQRQWLNPLLFLVIRKRWEGRVTGHRLCWSSPFCLSLVLFTQPVFRCAFRFTCPVGSSLGSFSVQFHSSDSGNSSDNCFFIVSVPHTFLWELTLCFLVTSKSVTRISQIWYDFMRYFLRGIKSAFTDLSFESLRFCRF